MTPPDLVPSLLSLAQVILIDVTLAGDNALMVGLAVHNLQAKQRRLAIIGGIGFAAVLRMGLALIASRLLSVTGLAFIGGVLLLWVCWKLFRSVTREAEPAGIAPSSYLGEAILQIVIADLSMSLDNIIAVAGASIGHPIILIIGLGVSILLMGLAATLIAKILLRYRWTVWVGLGVIFCVALELLIRGGYDLWVNVLH